MRAERGRGSTQLRKRVALTLARLSQITLNSYCDYALLNSPTSRAPSQTMLSIVQLLLRTKTGRQRLTSLTKPKQLSSKQYQTCENKWLSSTRSIRSSKSKSSTCGRRGRDSKNSLRTKRQSNANSHFWSAMKLLSPRRAYKKTSITVVL